MQTARFEQNGTKSSWSSKDEIDIRLHLGVNIHQEALRHLSQAVHGSGLTSDSSNGEILCWGCYGGFQGLFDPDFQFADVHSAGYRFAKGNLHWRVDVI